ncbi:hypothetical protein CONPUDRAFT_76352 [Coniophora puteana RWD-64-598 SS2]|uniref:Uncharacterized protein n=1 Tax=Coniophora puteana (strain RWD-64-598) TaxID=741705 RepID=A0A5M3MCL3_CONPW|nr:uncharacterized protein CONPUDRAFT_76352 [Coniophora puteana RWD-64-598 SS2]EIW76766.1 hypothetical protein CONPUDRAFT_76352 [Coniophora puteana RWD-64-598 SS2]
MTSRKRRSPSIMSVTKLPWSVSDVFQVTVLAVATPDLVKEAVVFRISYGNGGRFVGLIRPLPPSHMSLGPQRMIFLFMHFANLRADSIRGSDTRGSASNKLCEVKGEVKGEVIGRGRIVGNDKSAICTKKVHCENKDEVAIHRDADHTKEAATEDEARSEATSTMDQLKFGPNIRCAEVCHVNRNTFKPLKQLENTSTVIHNPRTPTWPKTTQPLSPSHITAYSSRKCLAIASPSHCEEHRESKRLTQPQTCINTDALLSQMQIQAQLEALRQLQPATEAPTNSEMEHNHADEYQGNWTTERDNKLVPTAAGQLIVPPSMDRPVQLTHEDAVDSIKLCCLFDNSRLLIFWVIRPEFVVVYVDVNTNTNTVHVSVMQTNAMHEDWDTRFPATSMSSTDKMIEDDTIESDEEEPTLPRKKQATGGPSATYPVALSSIHGISGSTSCRKVKQEPKDGHVTANLDVPAEKRSKKDQKRK